MLARPEVEEALREGREVEGHLIRSLYCSIVYCLFIVYRSISC